MENKQQSHDSTGIAQPDARILKIYVSSGHDYWGKHGEGRLQSGITEVGEVECVAGTGLRGDRYFGYKPDFKGQVTFFDSAIVDEVRSHFKLARLPASVFRRNVVVQGVCLASFMGKRFTIQGIEFEGAQECKPCHWMDRAIAPGGEDFLKGKFRGGLRAKIISGGVLRVDA
jgi:MOSC domain-containing protein YiiM